MGSALLAITSFLPISTKRPNEATHSQDVTRPSPESELRTTSTSRPPVTRMTPRANDLSRLDRMWSGAIPYCSTSSSFLSSVPTIAMIMAPKYCATCTVACPVPPAAEWISAVSPARRRALSFKLCHAVTKVVGREAASVSDRLSGILTTWVRRQRTNERKEFVRQATALSPTRSP
ncbi:hypothetical protein F4782DRAFT_452226 [Xylaria castorea]|nr:hypothetical protein F4782DRAFT_452226 [Xylaria castorea]